MFHHKALKVVFSSDGGYNELLQMSNEITEFAKLRALRAFVPNVSSRITRLCAFVPSHLTHPSVLRAFAPQVLWFLRALITHLARLICYLRALLLIRDIKSLIKGNSKMF